MPDRSVEEGFMKHELGKAQERLDRPGLSIADEWMKRYSKRSSKGSDHKGNRIDVMVSLVEKDVIRHWEGDA